MAISQAHHAERLRSLTSVQHRKQDAVVFTHYLRILRRRRRRVSLCTIEKRMFFNEYINLGYHDLSVKLRAVNKSRW